MLPERVDDLRAERVGDAVVLHWTTPSETTDHVALRGPVLAEVCRDPLHAGSPTGGAPTDPPCTVVQTVASPAGDQSATDALPSDLLREPVQVLAYRVVLKNAGGHSAGPSSAVLAAAGAAPPVVSALQARSAPGGVALSWTPDTAGPASAVQLMRSSAAAQAGEAVEAQPVRATPGALAKGDAGAKPSAGPVRLLAVPAGVADRGGALDPTAERDRTYSYRAVRVRSVTVGGAALLLRSADSAPATVLVRDVAPPAAPEGLVLATDGLQVDLSWEPEFAADLAGYVVYRAEVVEGRADAADGASGPAEVWQRVTPAPVTLPAFHDTLPHAGRYRFRVTAVDRSGNESGPSSPALAAATADQ